MEPPQSPAAGRRRVHEGALLVALVASVLGLVAGACSAGGHAADATVAAGVVSDTFRVPNEARACLQERFQADPTATRVVVTTGEPSDAARAALADDVEACVSKDQFAAAVAARISANLPPPDSAQTTAQVECLTTNLLALGDDQRRALLVGLVALGTPATGPLAQDRATVVNAIYGACGVTPTR